MRRYFWGHTIRWHLIEHAANKLRMAQYTNQPMSIDDALESVIDGTKKNTLGEWMYEYLINMSLENEKTLRREIKKRVG